MAEARVRIGPIQVIVVDALIALGLSAWVVVDVLDGGVAGAPALVIPLLLFGTVPLAWRRQAPLLVVALMSLATIHSVATADSVEGGGGFIAILIALYSLGAYAPTGRSLAGLAIVAASYVLHEVNNRDIETGEQLWAALFFAVIAATTFGAGLYVRRYREARELERDGERRAREAVADERARIARELHDIVSHNVSVMVLQAEAAEEALGQQPELAGDPLRRIQGTGRQALTEMRRMLGVLRTDPEGPALAPQPGLAEVEDLAAKLRAAGVPVTVRVEGQPVELPQGLALAAYRVIQESLTNALKHSGRAPVEVVVRYGDGALELVVTDDGRGGIARDDNGGHGIVGMRERVHLYDGQLEAGPRDDGGYRVRASLPLPAS